MATINDLSFKDTPQPSDQVPLYSSSNGVTQRTSVNQLLQSGISSLPTVQPVDGSGELWIDPLDGNAVKAAIGSSSQSGVNLSQTVANLANGTSTDAGALTGAEIVPMNRSAGLLQTTLTKIAQFVTQTYQGFTQSGAGAVARTILAKLFDARVTPKDFGAKGDGVTDDTAACIAVVASALSSGRTIEWPAGTYLTTATIPNFHAVQHIGSGIVKRGADTWRIAGTSGTNVIYADPTGNDANDGLTAAQPMKTVQAAFNAMANWQDAMLRPGTFRVQLSAGTFTDGAAISGLRSRNRFEVRGAVASGGVPTTIIDGTSATQAIGLSFTFNMYVYVKDVKLQNFTLVAGASSGVQAYIQCDMWTDNVHVNNCNFSGIAGDTLCHLYVSGGIINACQYGVRPYGQTNFIVGYSVGTTITNCTSAGVFCRDSTAGDTLSCTFTGNAIGVYLLNQCRSRLSGNTFTSNTTAVQAEMASTWYDNGNTYTSNTTNYAHKGFSLELANTGEYAFNKATLGHMWGGASSTVKYHFKNASSGASLSGGANLTFEDTAPIIGLAGAGTGNYGLQLMKPGNANYAYLLYVSTDNTWRLNANGTEIWRAGATAMYPSTNNVVSLGLSGNQWTNIYSKNVELTPAASVTPSANGSMSFQLTSDTQLTFKVKGSDGTVRSASLTLA